jgi:uncharacterized membrane protein
MDKTIGGLDENVGAALTYGLGWISGAAFLLLEPSNKFVRFHAWQSVITFGALSLAWLVSLSIIFVGWLVAFVVILPLSAALWLLLMFRAYRGERFKLPLVGDIAEQQLGAGG